MVALGGLRFDHHFALQYLFFRRTDFGVANHAAFQEQVARCGANPGINGDWRIPFSCPGNHTTHAFKLSMHVLHRLHGLIKQFAESIRYHFGAGVLNQVGFTRLGDQR